MNEFRERAGIPDGAVEFRTQETNDTTADELRISGLGSPYEQRVTLGGWWEWDEEVATGAWARTVARDGADIRSMFNHDPNQLLGRTTAGTLRLDDTTDGLHYEVDINPDDPAAVGVHARVERGDVTGASVWFRVVREEWTEPTDDNGLERPLRRILEAELFEVGPVVFPAFPQTTAEAAARSIDTMLRAAGVTRSSKRAALTVDLLADPTGTEARIADLLARNPDMRDRVCTASEPVDQPAADTPDPGASRSHLVAVRRRQLDLLARVEQSRSN